MPRRRPSHAVFREGLGCQLDHGDAVAESRCRRDATAVAERPEIAGPRPSRRKIRNCAALDRAFAEPDGRRCADQGGGGGKGRPRHRRTYAEGYGIDTPLLGFSATKSVISALTGILVRKGALTLDQPAPVAAWQGPATRGMPSRSIICCGIPRAGDRSFARGLAGSGARAGQPDEVHGIRHGGLRREHALETAPGTAGITRTATP